MVTIETLPGGVRLITEAIPTVRSASLGIWVKGGSRVETAQESGAAHFIDNSLLPSHPSMSVPLHVPLANL